LGRGQVAYQPTPLVVDGDALLHQDGQAWERPATTQRRRLDGRDKSALAICYSLLGIARTLCACTVLWCPLGIAAVEEHHITSVGTRDNVSPDIPAPVSQIICTSERQARGAPNILIPNFLSGADRTAAYKRKGASQQLGDDAIGGRSKRLVDIVLGATALVLSLPLMLLVAIAIRTTMGGPVLFSQLRIGRNGVPFRCYKFRTMVNNGEEALRKHLATDPQAAIEWRATCKLQRDPRVTPVGNILRKSSLDELPQLLNILRGEMSCVGPRPVVPGELARYGDNAGAYLRSRPGLTGLWQTCGRSRLSYNDRVALDVHYVSNWSLWLDFLIIIKTVPAVLNFHESA
jgi:exopolysaccharide production protein ExoY